MSPRKPNMLEAFQASAKADKARQAEAAEATTAPVAGAGSTAEQPQAGTGPSETGQGATGPAPSGAGGPFAGAPPTPSPAASPGDLILGTAPSVTSGLRGMLSDEVLQKARLPLIGVGVVLAMLLMFFLGRQFGGGDEAQAAAPGQATEIGEMQDVEPRSDFPVEIPNSQQEQAAGRSKTKSAKTKSGLTAADRAFLDKRNRWSVRAIQFSSDPRGSKLALSTYKYLRQKGLPAVAPITQGDILVICVGAEPSRNAKIEGIHAQLLGLAGPPPGNEPGAFDSAYFVNIEDQIDEKHRQ